MAPSSEHSSALTCPLLCCCLLTTLLARCFWVSFIARPLWDHSYVPPHLLARIEARACHLYVTAAMLLYGADDALERISHLDAALEGCPEIEHVPFSYTPLPLIAYLALQRLHPSDSHQECIHPECRGGCRVPQ